MARILVVGNVTLDIINSVESWPHEDEEVRALAQERRRGGNAGNNAVVLAQLGHAVHFAGCLAEDPDAQLIRDDLARHGVDLSAVHTVAAGKVPTSYVALSRRNGSRTIIHYRDLPEYPAGCFTRIPLHRFDWIHFEARDVEQLRPMLEHARQEAPRTPVSMEVEKHRPGVETLFAHADLLLFSKVYARHHGFDSATALLDQIHRHVPQARLACGWGARGAYAMDPDGVVHFAPAFPPARVVDTLGAGDVFNATLIDGLVHRLALNDALIAAARLAGRKCGRQGLDLADGPAARL